MTRSKWPRSSSDDVGVYLRSISPSELGSICEGGGSRGPVTPVPAPQHAAGARHARAGENRKAARTCSGSSRPFHWLLFLGFGIVPKICAPPPRPASAEKWRAPHAVPRTPRATLKCLPIGRPRTWLGVGSPKRNRYVSCDSWIFLSSGAFWRVLSRKTCAAAPVLRQHRQRLRGSERAWADARARTPGPSSCRPGARTGRRAPPRPRPRRAAGCCLPLLVCPQCSWRRQRTVRAVTQDRSHVSREH